MTPEEQAAADEEAARLTAEAEEAEAEQALASGFHEEVEKPGEVVTEVAEPTEEEITKIAAEKEFAEKVKADEEAARLAAVPQEKLAGEVKQALETFSGNAASKIATLEQTILSLQQTTPLGKKVEITDADFAELTADIPDMTPKIVAGLKRIFDKVHGLAAPVAQETPEQFEARVNAVADKRIAATLDRNKKQEAIDALTKLHPNWQAEIGPKDSDTEYRRWLATQPYHFATEALSTWDANTVSDALTKFHDFKKGQTAPVPKEVTPEPKKPATGTRVQRLAEAVTPKGSASAPVKKMKTPEDEFAEGFNS